MLIEVFSLNNFAAFLSFSLLSFSLHLTSFPFEFLSHIDPFHPSLATAPRLLLGRLAAASPYQETKTRRSTFADHLPLYIDAQQ